MDKKVTVVNCVECKHYKRFNDIQYGECGILKKTMKDTDFCSYAEKKKLFLCIDDHTHSGLIDE